MYFGDDMIIHYCAPCGVVARKLAAALMEAMKDPSFMADFEQAVDEAERQ